ncbi:type II secretion system minor pseudopilin GspJ [Vibrio sp.]|uniref:Type II secretion system protein J n=1 Tax=Vibrio viridaestus TaxID=2487322 RepID=A0A3N9TBM0_9VIBR|nr:type II secretion system minor pseudopilin GspJ [Vibrio viridaestus]MDC0610012.1 type II secretion system minor pseudopilin GspJ [Vibrio sp.]RQW61390.1 type II secretion system protein GspJ [Vibrio viridaestus]
MLLNRRHNSKGFTLIEMLVAIVILAMLSLLAYQILYQVQVSNDVSSKKSEQINRLQKAIVTLDSDFRQIADRQFRTNGEEAETMKLYWQDGLLGGQGYSLLFTRLGWGNHQWQFPRGEVTKVGYRLHGGKLERVWWRYPDTTVGDTGNITPILEHVSAFNVRFYYKDKWYTVWEQEGVLPKAISVELTLEDYGKIERTYLIASYDSSESSDG